MAQTITIGTFNIENLFTRYRFPPLDTKPKEAAADLVDLFKGGVIIDGKKFKRVLEDRRVLTARAIKAVDCDILGLQEVENLDTLKLFNTRFLTGKAHYPVAYLIDGNDPRFIDVGLLSRWPVDFLRTHQFLSKGRSRVFSRDCLEAHFRVGEKTLPVFVNHLKSMMDGREPTKQRRLDQCEAILGILRERFGTDFGDADFVVVGDLNDYMEAGRESESGLQPLLECPQMENVLLRVPESERWTHYYKKDKSYHQLDYILLSKALAARNPAAVPVIERRGQPLRVNQKGQPPRVPSFFPEVKGTLKASDHCPVAITISL